MWPSRTLNLKHYVIEYEQIEPFRRGPRDMIGMTKQLINVLGKILKKCAKQLHICICKDLAKSSERNIYPQTPEELGNLDSINISK